MLAMLGTSALLGSAQYGSALLGSAQYSFHVGALAAGHDIPGSPCTGSVAEAKQLCDRNVTCVGFTYNSPDPEPPDYVRVYLKFNSGSNKAEGWSHYLKVASEWQQPTTTTPAASPPTFLLPAQAAAPSPPAPLCFASSGLSWGSVFLILFFVGAACYLGGGLYYNTKKRDPPLEPGVHALPHIEYWRTLPGLVKDGCSFAHRKGREAYMTHVQGAPADPALKQSLARGEEGSGEPLANAVEDAS